MRRWGEVARSDVLEYRETAAAAAAKGRRRRRRKAAVTVTRSRRVTLKRN